MRTAPGVIRLVALLSMAMSAGACGPSTGTNSPAASGSPALVQPSESPTSEGSPTASPSAAAGSGGRLTVDASLLRVLPARIDGVALESDPVTAARIAADPTVAESAQAIAVALAIRPGASTGDDLAIVSVIRLRPGVFGEAWFANWRTTYDQGACDVAGGVKGSPSQATIAGRTVFIGTCAGDAQTYHVHLADPSLIVSITAAGAAHFGELVVAGLAE